MVVVLLDVMKLNMKLIFFWGVIPLADLGSLPQWVLGVMRFLRLVFVTG